jgi:hypothetical protein
MLHIGTDHQHLRIHSDTTGHDRQRFFSRRTTLACSGGNSSFAIAPRSPPALDRGRVYKQLAAVLARRSHSVVRRVQRGSQTLRRELEESQEVREEVRAREYRQERAACGERMAKHGRKRACKDRAHRNA